MASKTILCVLALAVASFAAPAEEPIQVPLNTQVAGAVNVKAPLQSIPIPATQITVHERQEQQQQQQQPQQEQQEQQQQQQQQQQILVAEQAQQEPLIPLAISPAIAEIQGGEPSPDLIEGEVPEGENSDLDTANSFWGGWGRRHGWGGGWGGGYGGYYRPYYGGYHRGHYGHGWGRGYGGGWGGYWG